MQKAWKKGGTYAVEIKNEPKVYDEDCSKLASYMTKDEHTKKEKKDGTLEKPRLKEASYNTSRNMPLKKPHVDELLRWKNEVKPRKGYYIVAIHEGINPVTGFKYRRYTMAKFPEPKRKITLKRRI